MRHLKSIKIFESVNVVDAIFSKIKEIKDTDVYEVKKDKHQDDTKISKGVSEINNIDNLMSSIEGIFGDIEVGKFTVTEYKIQCLHFVILREYRKSIKVFIYGIQDEYYYVTLDKVLGNIADDRAHFICDQFYGILELLKFIKKILDQA